MLAILLMAAAPATARPDDAEFFEARIRPLLIDRCYACHNAATAAEGGLALDSREGLRTGGHSGPAIAPGDPRSSLLVRVLRHEVDGLKMPKDSGRLSPEAIADVERWIAAGAPDPRDAPPSLAELEAETSWDAVRGRRLRWWSFQPLVDPAPPDGVVGRFGIHPVDRFLAAEWQRAGIEPAAEAPPEVLVRRLYFTLVGLPPSSAEASEWTARLAAPGGCEALVDHLLASPHFGERWARHWMDWIRYADTHGSEGDPEIVGTHLYRDALVRALDADVPLDRLLREHVAGDLLPDPRLDPTGTVNDSAALTAHWRMVFHGYSPTDPLEERVRFVDDQVAAFTKAFLGLTVSCARCHDHKFDPVSQRDYYALAGVLASSRPGRREVGPPGSGAVSREEIHALAAPLRRALAERWRGSLDDLGGRIARYEPLVAAAADARHLLHPLHRAGTEGTDLEAFRAAVAALAPPPEAGVRGTSWSMADDADRRAWSGVGSGLAEMAMPPVAGSVDVAVEGERAVERVLPRALRTEAISTKHGGRASSPTVLVAGEQELWILAAGAGGATVRYVVEDYPRAGPVYPIVGLTPEWKWHRFDLTYWDGDRIHVEAATARDAVLPSPGAAERSWFALREVRIVPRGSPPPPLPDDPRAAVAARIASPAPTPADYRAALVAALADALTAWRDGTATDRDALLIDAALAQGLLENRLAHLPGIAEPVAELRRLEALVPSQPRVPAPEETAGSDHPLFRRGDHRTPGDPVPRGFPPLFGAARPVAAGSGRRELAEDLLAPGNPLPRRVLANRVWHHLWGRGIAATPDNLGHLGQPPTHPQLLDHLAVSLERGGWSLKRLVRHVVTARAWRLDSAASPASVSLDPDNRLWSRSPVRRLEAEPIRDAFLACAGTLDRSLHGPPTSGTAPRRSVYVRVARNAIDPLLRVFDFPEPASATGARDVTNVPAQALALLNDAQVTGWAEAFAARLIAATPGGADAARLDAMVREAFGRPSRSDEREELARLLAAARDDVADRERRSAALEARESTAREALDRLLDGVRRGTDAAAPEAPAALFAWDFSTGAHALGGAPATTLHGGAEVRDGALVVARGGHATTAPLPHTVKGRTLAALVQLDSLDQRGGGVMSIQSADGAVFDAIVFAEQQPGEWLAGSNVFARTRPFGGPPETEALVRPVHLAICWDDDGTVRGYRDGTAYGAPYRASPPVEFPAGATVVSFGLRHLPAGGNRLLSGRILRATLHDRALSAQEVSALAAAAGSLSREALIERLPAAEAGRARGLVAEIDEAHRARRAIERVAPEHRERAVWAEAARALFLCKEFVYLR